MTLHAILIGGVRFYFGIDNFKIAAIEFHFFGPESVIDLHRILGIASPPSMTVHFMPKAVNIAMFPRIWISVMG
jgi:hypothetical protein